MVMNTLTSIEAQKWSYNCIVSDLGIFFFSPQLRQEPCFFSRCILTHSGSKQQRIGTYELDYLPIYLPVYSNCSFNLAPHRLLHLYLFILSLTHSKAHRKVNDLISQHQSVFNHSATLYRILMDLRLLLCSELTPKVTWEKCFYSCLL